MNGPQSPEPDDASRLIADPALDADERAAKLLPLVYEQLRTLARARMVTERPDHTLQATALVHEAYAKLIGDRKLPWQNRGHFFAAAAEAMRQVLLDHARTRGRLKRGGGARRMTLSVVDLAVEGTVEDITDLDAALTRLEAENPEAAQIVRLRFYAGLSLDETAEVMGLSRRTLDRRWEFARAWLFRAIGGEPDLA